MGSVSGVICREKTMKPTPLVRLMALAVSLLAVGGLAEASVRLGTWEASPVPRVVERQPSFGEQLAYLGPEQRREMRQQMRDQWQQSPPSRREERREFREQYRERWQQMPSDDRYRMREEMREQRGRDRGFGGRR